MSNFLVLGLIPGTNIQVTFTHWLLAIGAVAAVIAARQLRTPYLMARMALVVWRSTQLYGRS